MIRHFVRSPLRLLTLMLIFLLCSCESPVEQRESPYLTSRAPLHPNRYLELPLGSIKPGGWLLQQLELMRDGMTGHLDEWYPSVVGSRNGWLGGDGDGWERGPYWLDGLVPLAWLLEDEYMKEKAMPWIEWALNSQTPSGYFGPVPFEVEPDPEPGLQKTRRRDWWPKMVMLKVLQQYYEATLDERVVELMLNYFRFQLKELPDTPLDHWTFWANRRGGDNLMLVYWLYNLTGEPFLLELADLIYAQTFPWSQVFLNQDCYSGPLLDHLYPYNTGNRFPFDQDLIERLCTKQLQSFHCVNFAQGIKAPVIRFQQDPDQDYLKAVRRAMEDMVGYHGQPQGMYGGDEPMHGKDPTQGIELCSVVELMYSLEKMIAITGDYRMMDHLEKIAYNALPAQISNDFSSRQYFQQANQVMLTRERHNFYEEDHHGHTDLCFGLLTGYPCCTCNMHQGWPKLVTHMWYATAEGGLAAILYGPCTLSARVAGDVEVSIAEKTNYPFEDRVMFQFTLEREAAFPLQMRIPGWCSEPAITLNGDPTDFKVIDGMAVLERTWKDGDQIELHLPMEVKLTRWVENSVSVERGPLVYVLKIREEWKWVENADRWGDFWEVRPLDPWNIGLTEGAVADPSTGFRVVFQHTQHNLGQPPQEQMISYPWSLENTPIVLVSTGKEIPDWTLYRGMAGPLPHSLPLKHLEEVSPGEITLIPYGCSTLRITEFPVVR